MNIYECGMGTDKQTIEAPSASVAAIYYFANCVNANVPLVAVYTENGELFDMADAWWISASLGIEIPNVEAKLKACVDQFDQCRLLATAPADAAE